MSIDGSGRAMVRRHHEGRTHSLKLGQLFAEGAEFHRKSSQGYQDRARQKEACEYGEQDHRPWVQMYLRSTKWRHYCLPAWWSLRPTCPIQLLLFRTSWHRSCSQRQLEDRPLCKCGHTLIPNLQMIQPWFLFLFSACVSLDFCLKIRCFWFLWSVFVAIKLNQ